MISFLLDLKSRLIGVRSSLLGAAHREEGQGLTEYALILAFVSIVAIVALQLLGTNISSILNSVAGKL